MKQARNLIVGVFICLVCILSVQTKVALATENTYEIKNDGKAKEGKDLYGDSKLPASFNNVKYYDVAIPYQLTAEDIGGYCTKTAPCNTMYAMSKAVRKQKQGTGVMYEFSYSKAESGISTFKDNISKYVKKHWTSNLKSDKSDKSSAGLEVVQDKNGTEYLLTAVQPFFFSGTSNGKDGFPNESGGTTGQLIDAVLTDGTVIHLICCDINAVEHTNGGRNDKLTCDWGCAKHHPAMASLKLKQYRNLFSACNGNQFEFIFGGSSYQSASKAINKLGLGNKRKIAYYRVYNKKIKDAPKPASEEVKKCMTKMGETKIVSEDATPKEKAEAKAVVTGTKYLETDFVQDKGMNDMVIDFADKSSLSDSDLYNLKAWQSDIEKDESEGILITGGRYAVLIFGILFEVWMLFIYLAYWFDRINNFVDIDLLKIVTFGRLVISPTEEECTFSMKELAKGQTRTINHRHILYVCIVGLAFGTLIVSGKVFDVVNNIVTYALNKIG